jgi:hypothetical protein
MYLPQIRVINNTHLKLSVGAAAARNIELG